MIGRRNSMCDTPSPPLLRTTVSRGKEDTSSVHLLASRPPKSQLHACTCHTRLCKTLKPKINRLPRPIHLSSSTRLWATHRLETMATNAPVTAYKALNEIYPQESVLQQG
jgi:hypothetical protein